jgi:UPF0716 protein FxsA
MPIRMGAMIPCGSAVVCAIVLHRRVCYTALAMTELRLLFRFLDKEFLFRLIFILLLYSIVPIAEIFLFMWLGEVVGKYLILAVAAVVGLLGMLIALREVRLTLERLRARIRRHEYPGVEFVDLAGILVGSILLLTPGFITDFVGFLLMIPFFRRSLGRAVTRRMDRSLHEVYEYLQLSDFE